MSFNDRENSYRGGNLNSNLEVSGAATTVPGKYIGLSALTAESRPKFHSNRPKKYRFTAKKAFSIMG